MAEFTHIQKSFSGGEISERMLMRDDLELHAKSVLKMQNFMPTLQGTAVRTPGSRYVYTPSDNDVRIIPYYSPANERALVEITPGGIKIVGGLEFAISPTSIMGAVPFSPNAVIPIWQQIVGNHDFTGGYEGWDADPIAFPSSIDGGTLGWEYNRGDMLGTAREWGFEFVECTLTASCVIPEDTTEKLILTPHIEYVNNFSAIDASYILSMKVGTTAGGSQIWEDSFTQVDHQVGYTYERTISTTPVALTAGTTLFITITITPRLDEGQPSTPQFRVKRFGLYSLVNVDTGDGTVTGTVPYAAFQLKDLQFVQSPYQEISDDEVTGVGKELVITHPSHKPHWLRFDGAQYVFEPIPFKYRDDQGADVAWEPIQWSEGNYPAACASFNGRLILAGSQKDPILGNPTGSCVETVWGTKVGEWQYFTDPGVEEVFPDDSIEFTTIFRSPIQWAYGQKMLLIGAREMEYVASADGIFQPADIGVSMQSTHGSSAVQPVGIGQGVLYPAEGGTKVRFMSESNENQGWVSPDLTYAHPELFSSGIVRMVRMRNPHQMMVAVMGNGEMAVLHMDSTAGVSGWSRINLNAVVKDACVVPDENGVDILYITVTRWVQGQPVTYVEAFQNWIEGSDWDYVQSGRVARTFLNVVGGYNHLIGRRVQVIGDGDYLGVYTVNSQGEIILEDSIGEPIYVTAVLAGLSMPASITTLPLVTSNPGSMKRFSKITVRGLFSSRVIINGERPSDRNPATPQNNSQPVDSFRDIAVADLGWDATQSITIEENAPVRSELLGIFGTVKANSV